MTENGTLFTIPCEGVFNQHAAVFRTALVGVGPKSSRRPILCVELEKDNRGSDRATIERDLLELASAHAHTRDIRTILFHPAFPVDHRHNAKINRERLSLWAEEQLK